MSITGKKLGKICVERLILRLITGSRYTHPPTLLFNPSMPGVTGPTLLRKRGGSIHTRHGRRASRWYPARAGAGDALPAWAGAVHPELLQPQHPLVVATHLEIKNDEGRHEFLDLTHICKENERQVNLRAFLSNMSGQWIVHLPVKIGRAKEHRGSLVIIWQGWPEVGLVMHLFHWVA